MKNRSFIQHTFRNTTNHGIWRGERLKKFAAGILNSLLPPEDSASKDIEEIDTALGKVKNRSFAGLVIGDSSRFHN